MKQYNKQIMKNKKLNNNNKMNKFRKIPNIKHHKK